MSKMKVRSIMICAGGTGGHIFPAVALAEYCVCHGFTTCFITDQRGYKYEELHKYKLHKIRVYGFMKRSLMTKIKSLLFMLIASIRVVYIMLRERPKVVVCMGGYSTVPVGIVSSLMGISLLVHEQNVVLGNANRLLVKFCQVLALSFEDTVGVSGVMNRKARLTGLPVRAKFFPYRQKKHIDNNINKINLLIIGGSQGASLIDEVVSRAIIGLPRKIRDNLRVVHQLRESNIMKIDNLYSSIGIEHKVKTFFNNIEEEMNRASVVISRAGASSVGELLLLGKTLLLMPLASAVDSHQLLLAKRIEKLGYGTYVEEKDLNIETFTIKLGHILSDKKVLFRGRDEELSVSGSDLGLLLYARENLYNEVVGLYFGSSKERDTKDNISSRELS